MYGTKTSLRIWYYVKYYVSVILLCVAVFLNCKTSDMHGATTTPRVCVRGYVIFSFQDKRLKDKMLSDNVS